MVLISLGCFLSFTSVHATQVLCIFNARYKDKPVHNVKQGVSFMTSLDVKDILP